VLQAEGWVGVVSVLQAFSNTHVEHIRSEIKYQQF